MTAKLSKPLLTFWGTRGSISTPGRATEKYGGNTPCVSLRYGDHVIAFDAGTGIRALGLSLLDEFAGRQLRMHLFLSHTHWDHIQGLPFFLPAYRPGTMLTIHGSTRQEDFLESVLQGQMDQRYFPVGMSAFQADVAIRELEDSILQIGDLRLDWREHTLHPHGAIWYRVRIQDRTLVYATDTELDKVFTSKNGKLIPTCAEAERYLEFIHGADLLIGDGQYTGEEYNTYRGFGHSAIPTLIRIAADAQVKRLAVFHHDPQHSDTFLEDQAARWINRQQELNGMHVFWAREELTVAV